MRAAHPFERAPLPFPAKSACDHDATVRGVRRAAAANSTNASALAEAFLAACHPNGAWQNFDVRQYFQLNWQPGLPTGGSCATLVRVGGAGDGAKAMCADGSVWGDRCRVVSVGSDGDAEFEKGVHAVAPHCRIDTHDGTLTGRRADLARRLPDYVTFRPRNFHNASWHRYASRRQHVAVLKIDCESCEFDALAPWITHVCTDQILLELHAFTPRAVHPLTRLLRAHALLVQLHQAQYEVVHAEPNIAYSDGSNIEFTFRRRTPCDAGGRRQRARAEAGGRGGRSDRYIITLLGPHEEDTLDAMAMLASLRHVASMAPVLVFHEPSANASTLQRLRDAAAPTGRTLRFATMLFGPDPPVEWASQSTFAKRSTWGYQHMCVFFFERFLHHPALAHARYVWRMDGDACFHGPVPDLFTRMETRPNLSYVGLRARSLVTCRDPSIRGMAALYQRFRAEHGLPADPTVSDDCVPSYGTNFEVLRLDTLRGSQRFYEWARAVERSVHMYTHRWGDAELRRLALRLMGITPSTADGRVEWLEDLAPHAAYAHPCRPHKPRHLFVSKRRIPGSERNGKKRPPDNGMLHTHP